jgi:hypothetical protein
MTEQNFDDLRPYTDSEINEAMQRLVNDPLFDTVASYVFPNSPVEKLKEKIGQFKTIEDFQVQVMHAAMNQVVKHSITNFTYNGLQFLDNTKSYLFVSNHRDIILDSGLLQVALYENGFRTSEITFGSNLMQPGFVVDVGKSNKMFKVDRGGSPRDFYRNSKHLSDYIRYVITQKKESIWIAQRNGRTKDGNDNTDQGIIKMFCMSSSKGVLDAIAELNIVPIAVSYQVEPCDILKTNEIYQSRLKRYEKKPGEDLQSILTGINQFKGNVHFEITSPITAKELAQFSNCEKNDLYLSIAKWIDHKIQKNYKLFDSNYIAYDLLNNSEDYLGSAYTSEAKAAFISDMNKKLNLLEGDKNELIQIYLGIYSNSAKNKVKEQIVNNVVL